MTALCPVCLCPRGNINLLLQVLLNLAKVTSYEEALLGQLALLLCGLTDPATHFDAADMSAAAAASGGSVAQADMPEHSLDTLAAVLTKVAAAFLKHGALTGFASASHHRRSWSTPTTTTSY